MRPHWLAIFNEVYPLEAVEREVADLETVVRERWHPFPPPPPSQREENDER